MVPRPLSGLNTRPWPLLIVSSVAQVGRHAGGLIEYGRNAHMDAMPLVVVLPYTPCPATLVPMTPSQLRSTITRLQLSQRRLARMLKVDVRTVTRSMRARRRWDS